MAVKKIEGKNAGIEIDKAARYSTTTFPVPQWIVDLPQFVEVSGEEIQFHLRHLCDQLPRNADEAFIADELELLSAYVGIAISKWTYESSMREGTELRISFDRP